MTIFSRTAVPFFNLSNKIYAGATVTLYTVDAYGVKTATTATLYSSVSGSSTLSNPQTLDSRGMFPNPVYIETPVICTVSGLNLIADHDTGIVSFIEEYSDIAADAAAAATSAAEALVSETNAAASEATAADYAAAMTATSTTAITISIGSAAFVIETGKIFKVGQFVLAASDAAPSTNWMSGQITSYNSGTGELVVDVDVYGGSGSHADWNIGLSGPKGVKGDIGASGIGTGDMLAAQNLNDLADKEIARSNLGLKSAALMDFIDEDDMASNSTTKLPTQQSVKAYVDDSISGVATPDALSTASGAAPSFSARAFGAVNQVGTTTLLVGGNVSSITDNGVGDTTFTFTTAMASANYALGIGFGAGGTIATQQVYVKTRATTYLRLQSYYGTAGAAQDNSYVSFVLFM